MLDELSEEAKKRLETLRAAADGDDELVHDASFAAARKYGCRPTTQQVLEFIKHLKPKVA